jgi:hypothetical protein
MNSSAAAGREEEKKEGFPECGKPESGKLRKVSLGRRFYRVLNSPILSWTFSGNPDNL